MILLGAHIDRPDGQAAIAIINKTLKNVRHYYTVQQVFQVPAPTGPDTLARLYADPQYQTRKSVFSQDRRPRKEVSAHPVIVMAVTDREAGSPAGLRSANIPVEALFITRTGTGSTEKEPVRPGLGRDRLVPLQSLLEAVRAACHQQRLTVDLADAHGKDRLPAEMVCQALETMPDEEPSSLVLALAAPVWYRENTRYREVYQTSSTSVRKYK
ncbi:MAG: hypothetical protein ACLFPD_00985 [Desulfosudaceae bacterium]